jgi:hypothetical protein
MKRITLILILLSSLGLIAQDKAKQYMFKMSPQHLSLNMLKVGVERLNNSQTKSFSLYLFGAANHRSQGYISFPYSGGGAEIQGRKYLNTFSIKTNSKGQSFSQSVYLAGFAQVGVFRWTNTYTDQTSHQYFDKNIALGFTIGLQRTFWEVLVIDVFAGGGFQKGWSEASLATPIRWTFNNDRFCGPGYTGILPKVGLQIGVAL